MTLRVSTILGAGPSQVTYSPPNRIFYLPRPHLLWKVHKTTRAGHCSHHLAFGTKFWNVCFVWFPAFPFTNKLFFSEITIVHLIQDFAIACCLLSEREFRFIFCKNLFPTFWKHSETSLFFAITFSDGNISLCNNNLSRWKMERNSDVQLFPSLSTSELQNSGQCQCQPLRSQYICGQDQLLTSSSPKHNWFAQNISTISCKDRGFIIFHRSKIYLLKIAENSTLAAGLFSFASL